MTSNEERVLTVGLAARSYPIRIGRGTIAHAGSLVASLGTKHAVIVTNPTVAAHWLAPVRDSVAAGGARCDVVVVPDGEAHKSFATLEDVVTRLLELRAERGSLVVALGGGVVGDMAGFLAAIYMRGVDVVQIPTTLLAQVDASVGGKTGVDLAEGKNLIGAFHHPRVVMIDPTVLATLPDREFRAGLYEVMKCGLIRRPEIFEFMEQNRERILQRDAEALEYLITAAVQVKADVVAADEREGDLRRILNFGHTIGHALETETAYKHFLHGEAVAWGMVAASMIAAAMQKTDPDTARRIIATVLAYASLPKVVSRGKRIVKRLSTDKKTLDGVVHFILPTELGKVEIVSDVPEKAVIQAVEELRYLSQSV